MFEGIEVDCLEIADLVGTTNEIKPKSVLRLRSHGLRTLKLTNPIPEQLRRDLIHEAASLQRNSQRIKDFSDIEMQELSIFLSLVGKKKDNPLLKLGTCQRQLSVLDLDVAEFEGLEIVFKTGIVKYNNFNSAFMIFRVLI